MTVFYLQLKSNESSFKYTFSEDFLNKKYKLGLIKLEGELEIKNKIRVNQTNNKFCYSVSLKDVNNNLIKEDQMVEIPEENYDFDELIMRIKSQIKERDKDFFTAELNENEIKFVIKKGYKIDFMIFDSINNIFKFEEKILKAGTHSTKFYFEKTKIDQLYLKCNLIETTYINNNYSNILYRFQIDADGDINEEPRQIIYHKVDKKPNEIILKIVDSNNNLVYFSNINLFVDLVLTEITKVN
jgi:hypothetical protein